MRELILIKLNKINNSLRKNTMQDTDLKTLRDNLLGEISSLKDQLLNTDDENQEIEWSYAIEAKELQLKHYEDQLKEQQESLKNDFLQNLFHNRRKNTLPHHSDQFKIAQKDAEETAFKSIVVSPEDIAHFFSTNDYIIQSSDGHVRPKKFMYKWYVPLHQRKCNIIPLSPGISVPKKRFPNGQVKDIFFTMERFYSDSKFIQRCQEYYSQFNIHLDISRDKNKQYKRYWIQLTVDSSGIITFNNNNN